MCTVLLNLPYFQAMLRRINKLENAIKRQEDTLRKTMSFFSLKLLERRGVLSEEDVLSFRNFLTEIGL